MLARLVCRLTQPCGRVGPLQLQPRPGPGHSALGGLPTVKLTRGQAHSRLKVGPLSRWLRASFLASMGSSACKQVVHIIKVVYYMFASAPRSWPPWGPQPAWWLSLGPLSFKKLGSEGGADGYH